MGKSQRTKGAAFEREVAAVFSAALGGKIERNIGQARDGGNDIDVGVLCIEAKRRKSLKTLRGWYAQVARAAYERESRQGSTLYRVYPVVVMREDSGERMALLSLADFIELSRERIKA